ncbi:MAG TPA: hypothetical protein VFI55_05915 [Mycobacterium sp.]|nr:hypothetical protein [Mycobacterium sp.]
MVTGPVGVQHIVVPHVSAHADLFDGQRAHLHLIRAELEACQTPR